MNGADLRARINALIDAATALREAAMRTHLPVEFQGRLMALEEEAWKRLRAELASYYEGKS
jgi:hypothetical protein